MPNPKLYDPNITDKERKRIMAETGTTGRATDLVIIVRKIPGSEFKVNIDKGFGFKNEDERGDRGQVRKIIKLILERENINPAQHEVSVL